MVEVGYSAPPSPIVGRTLVVGREVGGVQTQLFGRYAVPPFTERPLIVLLMGVESLVDPSHFAPVAPKRTSLHSVVLLGPSTRLVKVSSVPTPLTPPNAPEELPCNVLLLPPGVPPPPPHDELPTTQGGVICR